MSQSRETRLSDVLQLGKAVLMAVFVFAASMSISCANKSDLTKIELQLPSASELQQKTKALTSKNQPSRSGAVVAASNLQYQRIMINVSGDGMSPVVRIWEKNDQGSSAQPPESLELSVPRGSNRLIQVLLLASEAGDGASFVFYGDQERSLNTSAETIDMVVNPLDVGLNTEGIIFGRFIKQNGTAPFGTLGIEFSPPGGKPPMVLDETPVYNGFFSAFISNSVLFNYRITKGPDKGLMLFNGVKADSAALSQVGSTLVTYGLIPSGFRSESGVSKPSIEAHGIAGFFGPGANSANQFACYEDDESVVEDLYSDADLTTEMTWYAISTDPSEARILRGGLGESDVNCTVADDYTEAIRIGPDQIRDGAGFYGPFVDTGSGLIDVDVSDDQMRFEWQYLPGVLDTGNVLGGITGVRLLTRLRDANSQEASRSASCGQLRQHGYVERVSVPFQDAVNPVSEYTLTLSAAELIAFWSGDLDFALCPYQGANELPGVIGTHMIHGDQGCMNCPPAATAIQISRIDGNSTTDNTTAGRHRIMVSSCYPIDITGLHNGDPAYFKDVLTVNSSQSNFLLFPDKDCSGTGLANLSINAQGQTSKRIYVGLSVSSANAELVASMPGAAPFTYHVKGQSTATPDAYRILGWPTNVFADKCYPIDISYWNSMVDAPIPRLTVAFNFTLPVNTYPDNVPISYFEGPFCDGTPLGNNTLFYAGTTYGKTHRRIYMRMQNSTDLSNQSVSLNAVAISTGDDFDNKIGSPITFDFWKGN